MIKIGFEVEAFCTKKDSKELILVPDGLPYDECGWLVETRSEPHTDVRKAIALLTLQLAITREQANKMDVNLIYSPLMEVPRDLKVKAAKKYGKGQLKYKNIYGFETHRCSTKLATASLHVSFTNERTHNYVNHNGTYTEHKYQGFIDHAEYIVALDKAFKREIGEAKRNLGFYEVKCDGRIEYRSLPNNVNLVKLEEVLTGLLKNHVY